MATYKLNKYGGVIRMPDGAMIPECPDNVDWRKYQEWLAEGNRPQPAYTPEELEAKQKAEEEAAREALIQTKMRELAISELKKEGKLPQDFSLVIR